MLDYLYKTPESNDTLQLPRTRISRPLGQGVVLRFTNFILPGWLSVLFDARIRSPASLLLQPISRSSCACKPPLTVPMFFFKSRLLDLGTQSTKQWISHAGHRRATFQKPPCPRKSTTISHIPRYAPFP